MSSSGKKGSFELALDICWLLFLIKLERGDGVEVWVEGYGRVRMRAVFCTAMGTHRHAFVGRDVDTGRQEFSGVFYWTEGTGFLNPIPDLPVRDKTPSPIISRWLKNSASV